MGGLKAKLIFAAIARAQNSLYADEPGFETLEAELGCCACLDGILIGKLKAAFGLCAAAPARPRPSALLRARWHGRTPNASCLSGGVWVG